MPDRSKLDRLYMDIARRIAQMSAARRLKVGAVLVKDDNIISMGWNGTPAGAPNDCEFHKYDLTSPCLDQPRNTQTCDDWPFFDSEKGMRYRLVTRPDVLHAESNALMKLAASGGATSAGSTLYVTCSPCSECAKLIKQARISRVVYEHAYRLPEGIELLKSMNINVEQIALDD